MAGTCRRCLTEQRRYRPRARAATGRRPARTRPARTRRPSSASRLGRNGDQLAPGRAPLAHGLRQCRFGCSPVPPSEAASMTPCDGQRVGVQQSEAGGEPEAAIEMGVERPLVGGKIDGRDQRCRVVEAGAEALAPAVGPAVADGDRRPRRSSRPGTAARHADRSRRRARLPRSGCRRLRRGCHRHSGCLRRRERASDARTQGLLRDRACASASRPLKRAAGIDGDAADRQRIEDRVDRHAGMGADAAHLQARGGELAVGGIVLARGRAQMRPAPPCPRRAADGLRRAWRSPSSPAAPCRARR